MNQLLEKMGEMGETGACVTNCHAKAFFSKHVSNLSIQIILCYKHLNKKEAITVMVWIGFLL